MDNFLDFNLNAYKLKGSFFGIDEKTDILTIKFGEHFKMILLVEFYQMLPEFVIFNKKMNYEWVSEEYDLINAKNEFFKNLLTYIFSGMKEKKLFIWLENWGFKYNETSGGYV